MNGKREEEQDSQSGQASVVGRLASVETFARSLADDIRQTNLNVSAMGDRMERLIGDLAKQLHARDRDQAIGGKTQWGAIWTAAGVVLSIVALGLSGYVRDQSRLEGYVAESQRTSIDAAREAGRREVFTEANRSMILANQERMNKADADLDERLQREFRLINDGTLERLQGLDSRLQLEIAHGNDKLAAEVAGLGRESDEMRRLFLDKLQWSASNHATWNERIRALERAVFQKEPVSDNRE